MLVFARNLCFWLLTLFSTYVVAISDFDLGTLKNNRGGGGEGLCFVAGTLVQTPDGVKPIELIQEGDLVVSKDEETGEQAWKPVVKLFRNEDKKVLNIRFASVTGEVAESIGTTAEHPFWVEGQGWVQAGELQVGDQISRQGQGLSQVMSITEDLETHTTYNFEVQDYHTYFVGEQALWVHNMCGEVNNGNANSTLNGLKLKKQLASQEQLGELSKGGGDVISQPAKQATRIASETGQSAQDIQKVTSSVRKFSDSSQVETHAFRNAKTNELIQPKTIVNPRQR